MKTKKLMFKKTTPKQEVVADEKKEKEDSLTKKEIKELVEETVDEALKEKEEKEPEVKVEAPSILSLTGEVTSEEKPGDEKKDEKDLGSEEENVDDSEVGTEESKEAVVTPARVEPTAVIDTSTAALSEGRSDTTSSTQPTEGTEQTPSAPTAPIISINGATPSSTGNVMRTTSDKSDNKKTSLILLFIVFVICGFVVGISILFILSKNNFKFPAVPSIIKQAPTPTLTVAPSPTQAPVDISKYTISVLNGSGVAGQAAQTKVSLTNAGFTVTNTGNASGSTSETTVAAKSTVDQATLSKLLKTLAVSYTVSSQITSLSSSATTDIVITLGAPK